MDGWMDGWTDGRMGGSKDAWMDGWMDGRMEVCIRIPCALSRECCHFVSSKCMACHGFVRLSHIPEKVQK